MFASKLCINIITSTFLYANFGFFHRNCTTDSSIPWRIYVEDALKSGLMNVLIVLGKNKKTCDLIKWSPQKLSPGCVCKKLTVPRFPSLDEPNVIRPKSIDEFPKQCVCHGLEGWSKGTPTLVTIKQKVNNNEYESLSQFNDDMLSTIDKFNVPELREEYKKIVTDVFPWFSSDFEMSSPRKSTCTSTPIPIISPPKFIPKISLNSLSSDIKTLQDIMGSNENNYYLTPKIDDIRVCQFCKKIGEGMPVREGRLLYCGDNTWAHANCALWSSEVFEEIDGSLQNVQLALSRGKLVRCVVCNEKGASVGCCYRNCVKTYHFQCGRKVFCVFNENKTVYCNNHASDTRCSVKDFTLERLIYIEQEDVKCKRTESSEIHILIGSLYISCIGNLHPFLSDSVESILPVDFKAKRYYWSIKEPWKLIQYNCTTKIENYIEKLKLDELHYTIDHNKEKNDLYVDCEDRNQDLGINLFTSIQVDNLQKCYETLKRCPIDTSFEAKRLKIDRMNCFTYPSYDTDSEYESTIDETCRMELFSNSYGLKHTVIPQYDGLYDSSDCESDFDFYQLNSLTDFNECTNDQPVKCDRCHRTYRTIESYERHLDTCNFDYEIGSDSESSDDEKSDKRVEDNCSSPKEEHVLRERPLKYDQHVVPQQSCTPVTPVQTEIQHQQQQPSPTVILQPVHTSFVQPSVSDVQYITINSTPPQSVMSCFQYQTPSTVIVQPSVVDPTTMVINNPPVDMFVSQSNNLLFSSQPMIVGLDQYTMPSNYNFTQSPQIYQSPKHVEQISNSYYIINTDPSIQNEWSYNLTSNIKTIPKDVCTQPKVYTNRKLRSTESYAKENIPNSLVQSVENQVYGVMNIMKNVNPEPWKKPTMKTYPPKRVVEYKDSSKKIEEKRILPKSTESHLPQMPTSVNMAHNKTPSAFALNNIIPTSTYSENKTSPSKFVYKSPPTIVSNNASSPLKLDTTSSSSLKPSYNPLTSAVKTVKALPSQEETKEFNPVICSSKSENMNQLCINDKSAPLQQKLDNLTHHKASICEHISTQNNKTSLSQLPVEDNVTLRLGKSASPPKVKEPSVLEFNKSPSPRFKKEETCSSTLVIDINTSPTLEFNKLSGTSVAVEESSTNKSIKVKNSSSSPFESDKPSAKVNSSSDNPQNKIPDITPSIINDKSKKVVSNIELTSNQEKLTEMKTQTGRLWCKATGERERTVPHLMFEMSSADDILCKDRSLVDIWTKLFDAVQVSRNEHKMPQLTSSNPYASDITAAIRSLGLSNNFLKYLLEQLSGAKEFVKYKPVYHKGVDVVGSTTENQSGCARTGIVFRKNRYDMFSWLASRHRKPPKLVVNYEDYGGRRANALPNEMKYRNMNKALTSTVGVYRSDIHGRGLFCLRDIEQGEYIIEYTGEVSIIDTLLLFVIIDCDYYN